MALGAASWRWAVGVAVLAWATAIGAPGAVGAKTDSCVLEPSLLNKATGMSFTAVPHPVALGAGSYYCIYNSTTFTTQGGGLQLNIDVSKTSLADYTTKEKGWEAYGDGTTGAAFEKVKALAADHGYLQDRRPARKLRRHGIRPRRRGRRLDVPGRAVGGREGARGRRQARHDLTTATDSRSARG